MSDFLNLILPWQDAPNDQVSDLFVYLILAVAILLGACLFWKTRRRSIDRLARKLGEYNRPVKPQVIQELEGYFQQENDELSDAWREFEDSLITRKRSENQQIVYKTDEASLFFSEDRLLGRHLNLRFWNSVPALLVGLGILGTFVGLVWGLIPFSGIDFTLTDEIQRAIKELLSGVSTAFVTSLWGMLTSLVFNWIEKQRIGRMSRAITDLQRALDQLFTLTTQEEISFRQEDELTQQTAALKSFSTDLADKIKIAISPSLEKLNISVEELRRQKEESSTDAVGKLIKEFQDSLSTSTVTHMEELAKTVGSASQSLKILPEQMQEMIGGVQDHINQTRKLLSDASQQHTENTKTMLDEIFNTFRSAIEEQRAGLSYSADRLNEETKQIAVRLVDTVVKAENSVEALMGKQALQTGTVNEQIENSKRTLEKGHELLQQMNTTVVRVGELIENSKEFSERLMIGSNRLESAGQRLEQAGSEFITANKDYLAANRETTQKIQDTLHQSKQTLDDFANRFSTINDGLNGIFSEIEQGLNKYAITSRESINQYLGAFSDQLSNAASALAGSVEALGDNVESLNDMVERRR